MMRMQASCVRIVIFLMSSTDLPALASSSCRRHRRFDRGLRMELGRERNLEQHVFHHIAAIRALELERLALEQHVVKAPGLGGQHRRITHLAGLRDQCQTHRARCRIAGRPRFARAGVRRMTIGAQRLAIDPCQRHRIQDFIAGQAEHFGDDGGRGDLHQHNVVEADLVERIFERDAALDFMRLDHAGQHVFHRQRLLAGGDRIARQPVGSGQNAAEVVGRMTPFGGQPGVVEIEPADHRADVECGLHRVELELRARHLGAVRHDRARHDRAHQFGAGRIFQRFQTAAERVDQAVARGVVGDFGVDLVFGHVIDDVDQDFIGLGTDVGDMCGHVDFPMLINGIVSSDWCG